MVDERFLRIMEDGLAGRKVSKDDCIYALSFSEDSAEADYAKVNADRYMRKCCNNTGQIGVQIGVITGPCAGDCKFCNFNESTTTCEPFIMPEEVLSGYVKEVTRYGDVTNVD